MIVPSSLSRLNLYRRLLKTHPIAIVSLIIIIFVIRRSSKRWIAWLIVRELHTSSGITNCKVARPVLTLALPAPFIFASLDIASHMVAATIFLGQAVAAGARLEFFIAILFVKLSNYIVI